MRGIPVHLPAEGCVSAAPTPRAVGGSLARAQPQVGEMNGSDPGPHFTLSQAIAKFYQALRSKSRIWHQPHKSWGPSAATSASPSSTNSSCFSACLSSRTYSTHCPEQSEMLSKSGLTWRNFGVPLLLHSVNLPKTVFPSSIKVCLHPAPTEIFHKKNPNKHHRKKKH